VSEVHEQMARIADGINKLISEVERLRRDIAALHARIEPFEGELPAGLPNDQPTVPRTRNLMEELHRLQITRGKIDACERHLNAMRATMDEIANDSISREDMKPWLKTNGRPRK
jgi:prefoldin subunit 5